VTAFDDLISSLGPQGASAWGSISTQLAGEGADQPTVAAAQATFTNTWNSLSTTFGMSADNALDAAQQYTFAASTVAGSVSMVQGLVGDLKQVSSGTGLPIAAVNMFTGSMIGIAVAAGAVSAGVGALVVGAVGLAASVISSVLGSPPGVEICPGINANPAPSWVINCTPVWGAAYSPGQNGWRSFPTSPEWFTNGSLATLTDGYTGAKNTLPINLNLFTVKGNPNTSPIEVLFPEYNALMGGVPPELTDFHATFVAAWKANKEFALNGQKPQDDAIVLQHCVLVWNRAHSSSSTVSLTPLTPGYEGSLVTTAISESSSTLKSANYIDGDGFTLFTGPHRIFLVPLTFSPAADAAITGSTATTSTPPATAAKTAVGVTAAAATTITLAAIVWSLATGKAWDWALGQAWEEIKEMIGDKPGGLAETRNRRRGSARRRSSGRISHKRR
jgi:hypothetical protein